jgi:urea transport system ATP-binding protein
MVGKPKLLLLDEPTEGIQPSIIIDIEKVLWKLKERGDVGIILVEQYLAFAWRLSDRYYVMEKGEFTAEGEAVGECDDAVLERLTA